MRPPSHRRHALAALRLTVMLVTGLCSALPAVEARENLEVRISFGHRAAEGSTVTPRLIAGSPGLDVVAVTRPLIVGAGAVDSVTAHVSWPKLTRPALKPHSIWQHLLDHGEPRQVARLKDDPGLQPGAPVLTVLTAADGTRGFSMGTVSFTMESRAAMDEITVTIDPPSRVRPKAVLVRLRHPLKRPLKSVTVNGQVWSDFDARLEWFRIQAPAEPRYEVVARY